MERLQSGLKALGPDVVAAVITFYEVKDPSMVAMDRRATIVPTVLAGELPHAIDKVPALREVAAQTVQEGFAIHLAGDAAVSEEVARNAQHDLTVGGSIGFVAALVLATVALGAVVAVSLPLIVTIAIAAAALALVALVGQVWPFMALATLGVFVLALAMAIIQSTFVVARYRLERAKGLDPAEAVELAARTPCCWMRLWARKANPVARAAAQ